jgi:hypothetical protein
MLISIAGRALGCCFQRRYCGGPGSGNEDALSTAKMEQYSGENISLQPVRLTMVEGDLYGCW